ncbi:MAG: metallophosphoesterase [Acidilobus sp.]
MWASALRVLDEAIRGLRSLPLIVNLEEARSIAVLGDVHGYDDVVDRFEQLVDEYSADAALMLGDFVDRGPNSTQTIVRILELVASEPRKFIPVRGDHEDPRMNEAYGFYEEVLYMQASDLYSRVVQAYSEIPIAATWNGVFLVHGGVPCVDCTRPEVPLRLREPDYFAGVKGTRRYLNLDDPVVFQMAWNDPIPSPVYFEPNPRGPGIYYYGRLAWSAFLRENGLRYIVRAHEVVDGVSFIRRDGRPLPQLRCDGRIPSHELEGGVVTVFSSRYHGGRAGALLIDEDGMTFKCL